MPVTTYYLNPEDVIQSGLSEAETKAAFESRKGLLWLDVRETTEEDHAFLGRVFNFHTLALEDCVSPLIHPPKIDDFVDHLFIIVHGINHQADAELVETAELAIFLGSHFVVSNHNFQLYSVDAVRRLVERDGRPLKRGADFLAYTLIDVLVDNVMPTLDQMSDIAEAIEEETIRSPQQTTLEAILKLKRSTLRIHRVMAPQREVMNRLSRREFSIIRDEAHIFYRDVYDHIVRIEDMNQSLLDRADNVLATHLASVANRQNETMRILSIVATIFMPLTLLAGIYGMNFDYMPELRWKWGYFVVLGVMALVIGIVLWRLWVRQWLQWGRKQLPFVKPFAVDPEKLIGYIGRIANLNGKPPKEGKN